MSRHVSDWTTGAALALAVLLTACSSSSDNKQVSLQLPELTLPNPAAQTEKLTAEQRENARILAS